tara:strand:- start:1656 stop:2567 length:912 start_codon:yes stop_codon:yes gene_type:complete
MINTYTGDKMSKFFKSVDGFLNNKIGKEMGKLDPRISGLLGSVFPGLGGGIENFQDNSFLSAIANSSQELQNQVNNAGALNVSTGTGAGQNSYDWRARLRPKNGGMKKLYGNKGDAQNSLLDPLEKTGGMVWQTTPQIFLAGQVDYNEHLGHGMNYPVYTYNNTRPPPLPVTAEFYANDMYEAQYILGIFHFIRTVTKSYFGESAISQGNYGTPPPVLIFEYMGDHGFKKVPVIMRSYSIELPDGVDYIPVASKVNGENQTTFVPTRTNIMVDLAPAYTPKKVREKFDLEAFRRGDNYKDGFV